MDSNQFPDSRALREEILGLPIHQEVGEEEMEEVGKRLEAVGIREKREESLFTQ